MKIIKKITLIAAFLVAFQSFAQVNVNVNIGTAPAWGPSGYSNVKYYYLPDIETYYDIHTNRYIYMHNGVWIRRTYLPTRYRNYDLYRGYKVVLNDYHGNKPYGHFHNHKKKYYKGYHGKPQKNIGYKPMKNKPQNAPKQQSKPQKNAPGQHKNATPHVEKKGGSPQNKGGGKSGGHGGGKGGSHGGGNGGGGHGGGGKGKH